MILQRQIVFRCALAAGAIALLGGCGAGADGGAPGAASAATAKGGDNGGAAARGGGAGGAGGRASPSVTLASSDIATVKRGTLEESTPITGTLDPIETVQIRSRLEGDLDSVLVREGDRVTQGQLLARFESSDEEGAQTSAQARLTAAKGDLATAQWNLEQTEELYKAGAVPERDYRAAQQTVATSQANVAAADAQLRTASLTTGDTRVLAPVEGIISERDAEVGEHISRGATLFSLVRTNSLELSASVPSRLAGSVQVGQTVQVVADGRDVTGRVARVNPTIDPATRAVTVYVQVPNPGDRLKGGTFATGRIIGRVTQGALLVPTAALRQSQRAEGVFAYRIDGRTLSQVTVQTGAADEEAGVAAVLDGLKEGDRVIVGNVGTVGPGMQVQVIGEAQGDSAGGGRGGRGGAGGGRSGGRGATP